MGCVKSRHDNYDIHDQHPNIFEVINVNEHGELVNPGQMEVTETELILYQRNKPVVIWPLKALRKYGGDDQIFSFESGRRCQTGEGIYAFSCRQSATLFFAVQTHMGRFSNEGHAPIGVFSHNSDFPIPTRSTGPPVHRRFQSQQPDGYINPVPASASTNPRPHHSLSRPGSLTSNGGPLSPTGAFTPVITEISIEHNNNKRGSLVPEHNLPNSGGLELENQSLLVQTNYVNFGLNSPPPAAGIAPLAATEYMNLGDSPSHLYMNVDTKNTTKETVTEADEDFKHCYANVDAKDMEGMRQVDGVPLLSNNSSVPQTPTALYLTTVHEVNYAELDLDPSKVPSVSQVTPDSPSNKAKSYATIDFERTNALSQSINHRMEIEDGSRKTRHNSTISDVTVRQSSSLSD